MIPCIAFTDVSNNNQSATNSCKRFRYDNTSGYPGSTKPSGLTNLLGRLAEVETDYGSLITDEWFSYTPRGEVSDVYQSSPHSGGYYHVTAQYWANSALKQLSGISGLPTITYGVDGEGRPYTTSASSGQNPVTNTVFNAASLPTSITYGSSDADSYTYDPNTNRITQYQFTVNGQSLTGALTWNADHTLASQNITDPFDSSDQQNCSYTHDDLSRLASVNCGSIFSQTFSYDAFGNISKSGTYQFQPTYNAATNRYASIPGATVSYDADGNILTDGSHTYTWDVYGKSVSADSVNLTYDALGRMVEQNRSGSYTQIVYSPGGAKLALMNGQTLTKGLISLPGGGQAVYNSSGLLYYGHSDHIGSIKLGSTSSRTVSFVLAYAPFGETYATSGTTDPAFTGQRQDTVAGLFDFPARQYGTQGRWPNPDPSGLASVGLPDPQTLNRYAYVRNNPLALVDPNGLCGDEKEDDSTDCPPSPPPAASPLQPDPTSGGDAQNSGGNLPTNTELIGPSGNSFYLDPNGDFNYSVTVTASLSDEPTVQTPDSSVGNTLLEDCGGCILGQMANQPESMAILNSASDWVTAATIYEAVGVSSAIGAGLVASLETVDVAVGAGSPIHVAVGSGGEWISGMGEFGNMEMMSSNAWVRGFSWFQFSVPVVNSEAVMATEGATVSTCVSGACQAIWNGWVH
jgi:RHS repeat-associated protein